MAPTVTLTLPGHPPEAATLLDAGTGPAGSILDGIYAWQVPAATTAATAATLTPGATQIDDNGGGLVPDMYHPVTVAGSATFPITLPPPTPPTPPPGAATVPARYPAQEPTAGQPRDPGTLFRRWVPGAARRGRRRRRPPRRPGRDDHHPTPPEPDRFRANHRDPCQRQRGHPSKQHCTRPGADGTGGAERAGVNRDLAGTGRHGRAPHQADAGHLVHPFGG